MPTKEDLLNMLNIRQLRQLAKDNGVELIIKEENGFIIKNIKTRKAKTLKEIRYVLLLSRKITIQNLRLAIGGEKPKSIKEPIVEEILSKKARDRKKGLKFEDKVAKWAKRRFGAYEVEMNILRRGYTQKRPYEIDVCARTDKYDLMIECKNMKQTIKRNIIIDYFGRFEDINEAVHKGISKDDYYFDYVMIVSTSKFEAGALSMANEKEVECWYYDGKKFNLESGEWI